MKRTIRALCIFHYKPCCWLKNVKVRWESEPVKNLFPETPRGKHKRELCSHHHWVLCIESSDNRSQKAMKSQRFSFFLKGGGDIVTSDVKEKKNNSQAASLVRGSLLAAWKKMKKAISQSKGGEPSG